MHKQIEQIISTDKRARDEARFTEEHRLNLESEIFSEKERIQKECMLKAEKEISDVLDKKRQKAKEKWSKDSVKYENIGKRIEESYDQNRDKWAHEIALQIIDQSEDE